MDNLVACRVAASLRTSLEGSILQEVVAEAARRFRYIFAHADRFQSLVISVESGRSWIGRPVLRRPKRKALAGPFAALCRRSLVGRRLVGLTKADVERRIVLEFSGEFRLVAELQDQGPNLVLLGPEGQILGATRGESAGHARLAPGAVYRAPAPPPGRADVFASGAAEIDDLLVGGLADGRDPADVLFHGLYGAGRTSIDLVLFESASSGRPVGEVLVDRLASLLRGRLDPVIEAPEDPSDAGFIPGTGKCSLLPWVPDRPPAAGMFRFAREDPAATAGLYYEALIREAEIRARGRALLAILDQEIARVRRAQLRVEEDRSRFEDPDRFRRWGEAILAGLAHAVREGEHVRVADPYCEHGRTIAVPAAPGVPLPEVAARWFSRHRRARRGIEQTEARAASLAARRVALLGLRARHEEVAECGSTEDLEREMHRLSIPVALERGPAKSRPAPVRLEGVRMLETSDGTSLLIGKSGRDNDRLTFKLAASEDFWLHAAGVPGAHVLLRNDSRQTRPSASALHEAAGIAAWFSDARAAGLVDVQWTRRKYVRRIRGAAPGTVTVKRHETVRVRPSPPRE